MYRDRGWRGPSWGDSRRAERKGKACRVLQQILDSAFKVHLKSSHAYVPPRPPHWSGPLPHPTLMFQRYPPAPMALALDPSRPSLYSARQPRVLLNSSHAVPPACRFLGLPLTQSRSQSLPGPRGPASQTLGEPL